MTFSIENIKALARLARLSMRDDELLSMQSDLTRIVGYVESLQKVNVEGVEAMTHATGMELPLRADTPVATVGREGLLGSQGYEDGLVKVPKIIE